MNRTTLSRELAENRTNVFLNLKRLFFYNKFSTFLRKPRHTHNPCQNQESIIVYIFSSSKFSDDRFISVIYFWFYTFSEDYIEEKPIC